MASKKRQHSDQDQPRSTPPAGGSAPYTIEFFEDDGGRFPVEDWLAGLDDHKQRAALTALQRVLAEQGLDVCKSGWGTSVGDGVYEFRIKKNEAAVLRDAGLEVPEDANDDADKILLRIFFHAHGAKLVLLLGGYEQGSTRQRFPPAGPNPARQEAAWGLGFGVGDSSSRQATAVRLRIWDLTHNVEMPRRSSWVL